MPSFGVSGIVDVDCKIQTRHREIMNDSTHKDVTFCSSCYIIYLIPYRKKMHSSTCEQVVAWNLTNSNKIWLIQKQSNLFFKNELKKKSARYLQLNKVSTSTTKSSLKAVSKEHIITSLEGNGSNFHETWSFIKFFLRWRKILVSTMFLKTNVGRCSLNMCANSLPLPSHQSRLPVTVNDSWSCPMVDSGNGVSVDQSM